MTIPVLDLVAPESSFSLEFVLACGSRRIPKLPATGDQGMLDMTESIPLVIQDLNKEESFAVVNAWKASKYRHEGVG